MDQKVPVSNRTEREHTRIARSIAVSIEDCDSIVRPYRGCPELGGASCVMFLRSCRVESSTESGRNIHCRWHLLHAELSSRKAGDKPIRMEPENKSR